MGGGVFLVSVFTLLAVTVGWYQEGHPCSCLDDFSAQALVITQHDRVRLEELSQKKVIWGICVREYFSLRLIHLVLLPPLCCSHGITYSPAYFPVF